MNRDGSNVRQLTDSKWEDSMGMYVTVKVTGSREGAYAYGYEPLQSACICSVALAQ